MVKLDAKAMQKLNQIPDEMKAKILANVYCSHCQDTVRIIEFTATGMSLRNQTYYNSVN